MNIKITYIYDYMCVSVFIYLCVCNQLTLVNVTLLQKCGV